MIEAVILDMDGVIVNSEDHWDELEDELLESLGIPEDYDKSKLVGLSQTGIYNLLKEEEIIQIDFEEFRERYDITARKIYKEKAEIREGIREIIDNLSVPLGLCSSSPKSWITMVLDRFDLSQNFNETISAEDIDEEGKPEPDVYLEIADRLEVEPENCLVVEDSDTGVHAAESAGMYCIGFKGTEGQSLEGADTIAESGKELVEQINSKVRFKT